MVAKMQAKSKSRQLDHSLHYSRTSQDMDVLLTLIFGKSESTTDIMTKISKFVQLKQDLMGHGLIGH